MVKTIYIAADNHQKVGSIVSEVLKEGLDFHSRNVSLSEYELQSEKVKIKLFKGDVPSILKDSGDFIDLSKEAILNELYINEVKSKIEKLKVELIADKFIEAYKEHVEEVRDELEVEKKLKDKIEKKLKDLENELWVLNKTYLEDAPKQVGYEKLIGQVKALRLLLDDYVVVGQDELGRKIKAPLRTI